MSSIVRFLALCAVLAGASGAPLPALAADPWLVVNDVHFDPVARDRRPLPFGHDTNAALLASTLEEMRRVAPNPPVIVMAGDFLSHNFKLATAAPTMVALARRFDRAFPHAQFVIALGNEDSPCGDYALAPNSSFLRAVAAAWAPLVNRNGAAPDFIRSFSRDGFYTAKLPLPGVRAVVVDDAFWSPLYHTGCGVGGDPTPQSLTELERALSPAAGERRWLVMHIPPGIDAQSTVHRVHRLAIVPFMRPDPRDAVLRFIGDPARRVEVVITGHVHRFAFRIVTRTDGLPVPVLVAPAVSPIFSNEPSFLTADVAADGVIRNLEEHSDVDGVWRDLGGSGTLGASAFTGQALVHLQRRLELEPELRETFATLYMGDSPYHEITAGNWRSYWCAAGAFNATAFRDCLDEGGFSFLTGRGVAAAGVVIVAALLAGAALIVIIRRRRGPRSAA